nr:AEC family transporter [Clostridium pasteurianum]
MLLTSIGNVLSIAIMIIIGYVLAYKKWFNKNSTDLLVKLVIKISLPPLLFSIMLENFDRNELIHSFKGLSIPLLSIFILFLIGTAVAKILNVQKIEKVFLLPAFLIPIQYLWDCLLIWLSLEKKVYPMFSYTM